MSDDDQTTREHVQQSAREAARRAAATEPDRTADELRELINRPK